MKILNLFNTLKDKLISFYHDKELKKKIYIIIFESDTKLGKRFDTILMLVILLSILLVIAESMMSFNLFLQPYLCALEYIFTAFFTIEYLLRLYCSPKPWKYATSFFGIIDLLATLPLYISWIFGTARYLLIIRAFRLIRVFRVFKLFNFLDEGHALLYSLRASSRKILVFFLFVLIMVISLGTAMYMVEGNIPETKFDNIPNSIYWAIVTLTTVGYGDLTPETGIGRFLSSIVMLLGYTIIAVPTGIVSASMFEYGKKAKSKALAESKNLKRKRKNTVDRSWKTLASEYIVHEKWLTVRKEHVLLPTGAEINDYYVLEYPNWVNIIAIDEIGRFVMVRQYRHAIKQTLYELCGGVCEADEDPLRAAQRELFEETGYGNGEWSLMMTLSPNASTMTNTTFCYLAIDVELLSSQHLDDTEDLSVHLLTEDEVYNMLKSNEIRQSLMAAPLWQYFSKK